MYSSSFKKIAFLSAIAALSTVEATTPIAQPQANYPEFAAGFAATGLNWEPYEAVTTDGQTLTVFRVFKEIDESLSPIFLHLGDGMLPEDWAQANWLSDVTNSGYDIWLASWRGMQNSNKNSNNLTGKEKWAWSIAEVGRLDIPAQIDVALAVTGKSKATLVAYSLGTVASLYGLATQQDYFATKLDRAVLIAACVYYEFPLVQEPYAETVKNFGAFEREGFYLYNWLESGEQVFGTTEESRSGSQQNYLHFAQINQAGQFQEFIPFRDYVQGTKKSKLVDFAAIDRVPVTMMHGNADEICPMDSAKGPIFDKIGNSDKNFIINEGWGHYEYFTEMDSTALMNIFETGTKDAALGFGLIGLVAATSAFF